MTDLAVVPQPPTNDQGETEMTMTRAFHSYTDLGHADKNTMTAMIRALGADPDHISADFAVAVVDGHCQLHLTEMLCNDLGRHYLADGEIASRPLVFDVDPERLPAQIRPVGGVQAQPGDHAPEVIRLVADAIRDTGMKDAFFDDSAGSWEVEQKSWQYENAARVVLDELAAAGWQLQRREETRD